MIGFDTRQPAFADTDPPPLRAGRRGDPGSPERGGRYRVLMFPDGGFLAHVSRLLEIAKVLRRDFPCEVRFAGEGPYLRLAREAGFEVDECFGVAREETLHLARRAGLVDPIWWHRVVARSIRADAEAIRRRRPDVVVGDMHWSLRAASLDCDVPYVSVVNASWTRWFRHRLRALDDHVLTTLLGEDRAARALPHFKAAALWYWALPYKWWRLRSGHRDFRTSDLLDIVEGDLTLLADVPEFCPADGLADTARFVGPILWNPPLPEPAWLDGLVPGRRTVYVSLGSTGRATFFEAVREAFVGTEFQVVMTTGDLRPADGALPPNFFVTSFAPGLPILDRADVSVNHGGSGTIYQALMAGVPVVGIPDHVDQQVQIQLCEDAGVGRKVRPRELTGESLRRAVEEVTAEPAYRRNAERIRQAIARYDGPRLAARALDGLVRGDDAAMRERYEPAAAAHPFSGGRVPAV